MKELRCLVFTDQEVVNAVVDRRRRMREKLPQGTIGKVIFQTGEDGEHTPIRTTIQVTNDDGTDESMHLDETEVAAALVAFCMNRRIPLPVESDKTLYVIKDSLTLMITLNFNKAPRLVIDHAHIQAEADAMGDAPAAPEFRPAAKMRRRAVS